VVCGAIIQSSPYGLVETLLELGHVLHATIRHYASRGFMESENVLRCTDMQASQLCSHFSQL
jgi:hypothetical protein